MDFLKKGVLVLLAISLISCAVSLPSNVAIRTDRRSAKYIDSVDFSYQNPTPINFNQLKLCIAENVTNRSVQITDAAGSFVGPFSGHYYRRQNTQTVEGGGIFKYADESLATLIANGTADGGSDALGIIRYIMRYDLKASVRDTQISLVFMNITRAQQNTGYATNSGFSSIVVAAGTHTQQAYTALEDTANRVKSCLRNF